MADQFDPQQFQEALEAYENEIRTLGKATAETRAAFQDAKAAIRQHQAQVDASWKKLGTSATDLTKGLYKGEKGVGVFGDAVETAGTALQTLILLIPGIGIAAKAAAFAIGAFAKGVNAAAKQGDQLYKTYQDLSKAGATTSGGIQDVFSNMQKFGYGLEELDKMVSLVSANAETLAKFSLTAGEGASAFAQGMQQLQRDQSLRELGKTTDDINNAGAAYIRQQVALGRNQRDIGDSLNKTTRAYILELDHLQRLTGKSAEQLQKEQDEALAEDAYNQVMSELQDRAAQGDAAAAAQIEKIKSVMANISPDLRKELALSIGGDVSAAQKLMMSAPSLLGNVMNESKGTIDTLREAGKDLTRTADVFGKGAKVGAYDREIFGTLKDARVFGKALENIEERDIAAKKNAHVIDDSTKSITETQIAQMNSRDALQGFVQLGVAPATAALGGLASAVDDVTSMLPGAKSTPGKGMNTPGYGAQGTGTRGGSVGSMAAGAATGAVVGSVVPVIGTGIGAAIGAAAGYLGYGAFGGTSDKPEDYLKFGGQSGSKEAFGKLNPDIQKSLLAAGKQYKDITGNMLTVNSAFRDSEKQKELYDAWIARGKTGMPVAPPGRSSHETGQAVDIEQGKNDRQAISALNAAGLFQTVANDPVHFSKTSGYKFGGIATGPSSGYQTLLHGTEAVVPLPDGKTIPVEIPGFTTNLTDQTSLMTQQLDKLDELVRTMQTQVSVSTKILQHTQ
jgi:hypothetical protein